MNNSGIYEIKRSSICELLDQNEVTSDAALDWIRENAGTCEKIYSSCPKYILVMKCIDEDTVLVTPVYDRQIRNMKRIGINGQQHWVRFTEFTVLHRGMIMAACGKKLDRPGSTITSIYNTHRRAKGRDWLIRQKLLEEDRMVKTDRRRKGYYAG